MAINKTSLIIVVCLATITILAIAASIDVFYFRRNRMVRNISSIVGEHIVALKSLSSEGTPMPANMLIAAMNQDVHPTNQAEAKIAMDQMLGIATEAKRRSFQMPMVNKEIASRIKTWAEMGSEETAVSAVKLLAHIHKRYTEHLDILMAHAKGEISATDSNSAIQRMRTLAHYVDGAALAGINIDPKLILIRPNDQIVETWKRSKSPDASAAAEVLLKSLHEAKLY